MAPPSHRRLDWSERLHFRRWIHWWPLAVCVLVLTWLVEFRVGEIPEHLAAGMVAPYNIQADRQYVYEDDEATEAARTKAAAQVRKVFDFDAELVSTLRDQVRAGFRAGRNGLEAGRAVPATDELRAEVNEAFGVRLTDRQWEMLVEERFAGGMEDAIIRELQELMRVPLVENLELVRQERDIGIVMRRFTTREAKEFVEELTLQGPQVDAIRSVEQARAKAYVPSFRQYRVVLRELLGSLLRANCQPNLEATKQAQVQARASIAPLTEVVKAGELIARKYERISARQVTLLQELQRQKGSRNRPLEVVGNALFITCVLLLLHGFARRFLGRYRPSQADLWFMGGVIAVMVAVVRIGGIVSDGLDRGLQTSVPTGAYHYLIPAAAAGMMIRFFLNAECALMVSLAFATIVGLIAGTEPSYVLFVLPLNIAGAAAIAAADRRSLIIRAGVMTGAMAAVIALALHFSHAGNLSESLLPSDLFWHVVLAFGGAMLAAVVVLALTPVAESLLGYTSDIKLLELANLNHPLLRELVVRAPGTYHHSHLVGILAEAAANAIGANALLTRVGAYYHDIGKMKKPTYFTENQKGTSPHERLTPHMSALIIASHVKEGIELARLYKLPKPIREMIPQHHGTKRISYFYERAKEVAGAEAAAVNEADFRYPGPKPQTREAGILLLSDGTEGAVRALSEKSPARIQQTVEGIINKNFAEGQLDECELTLKDLHTIGAAFTRILIGIYHQRIEYPREVLQLGERDVQVVEGPRDPATPAGSDGKPPLSVVS